MNITTTEELQDLLDGIEMVGTRFEEWKFAWKIQMVPTHPQGWFVQCSFERPDVNGDLSEKGFGFGRRWFVEYGTPDTGVVFTAWMAIQQIATHELHEAFTVLVNGKRVRLLDPHKKLSDLAFGSREVP